MTASTRSIARFAPFTSRTLMRAPPAATRCCAHAVRLLQRRQRVRQIRLQHDAGFEVVQPRVFEDPREHRDRQIEVAVLLHVEVDECAGRRDAVRYSGSRRSTTLSTTSSNAHIEMWLAIAETFTET